jgi:tRNA threonylcarbamoyl adenosine modification protein (Sua5/YciO/YrdC/YwlC family)
MKIIKINLKELVIGLDAGGAKTTALLSDLDGKILARAKTGPSHPRNLGLKRATNNTVKAIEELLKKSGKNNILAVFLGWPTVAEEYRNKKKLIKKELFSHKKIAKIFKSKIIIDSDQLAGFRSGTDKKKGLVLIAGSGCVCHGWSEGKEAKADGWGYLSEMGSSFFIGQKVLQVVFKYLDGRAEETDLVDLVLKKTKAKNKLQLIEKIYSKSLMEIIPDFSILCDQAAKKKDRQAEIILTEAAKELALSVRAVAGRLALFDERFPLVLIGSAFNSKILLEKVKREIIDFLPLAEIVRPEKEPAVGAVRLALEAVLDEKINQAAREIKSGKVAIFPTDTVYGLVADATSKQAVKKVFEIKQRSKDKPLPIFIKDLSAAKKIAKINKKQEAFLKKVWPGQTTVVLERKKQVKLYGSINHKIALRIPDYQPIRVLLEKIGKPLTGTSANLSGLSTKKEVKDILKQFSGNFPELVVDTGKLKSSRPSTVIDLTASRPKILRK